VTPKSTIYMTALLLVSTMVVLGGFGGLEVACWPLVPKFAVSNPAEAVGFFGRRNPQHAFLRRGSKAVCPMSCFTACKRTQKWRGSRHFRQKFLSHFSRIFPPSAAGFASVASEAGGLLWRKLERSKSVVLLQVGGFDVPLAKALCKTFLLRMLNGSWAVRNPPKGCSAHWRRRRISAPTNALFHILRIFILIVSYIFRRNRHLQGVYINLVNK
jgi:hypothetical protein